MKILIIDIESKIPNFALKKIEKYHADSCDEVIWNMPIFRNIADKIYVSCVFTKNKWKCKEWEGEPKVLIGGSGYSLSIKLPSEIEEVKPHINFGFTTRGCIRKCSFCIVSEKEGNIRIVGDLLDLWDGKSKDVVLMDNNIIALPEHFELVCKQAIENKIRVDFNQGLDHRLLTPEIVSLMAKTPHKVYRFSFDHPSYKSTVEKAIDMCNKEGMNRCMWFCLIGYNTTFQEDIERLNYLKERNQIGYAQRYEKCYKEKKYIDLARWANQHHIFRAMTFEQFLKANNKGATFIH